MSLKNRSAGESDEEGLESVVSLLTSLIDAVKTHVESWPRRYVEMRVGRFDDEK